MSRRADEAWVTARKAVIDVLARRGVCEYISSDTLAGLCPACGDVLGVRFLGRSTRVELICHGGCPEPDVVAALGLAAAGTGR